MEEMEAIKRTKQEQNRDTYQAKRFIKANPSGRIYQKNDEFASEYIWWLEGQLTEREESHCRLVEECIHLKEQVEERNYLISELGQVIKSMKDQR